MHTRSWKKEILTIPNALSVFRIALIPVYLKIYLEEKKLIRLRVYRQPTSHQIRIIESCSEVGKACL